MNPESMQGPILDSDGYPTDEAIRALENWEYPYHRIVEFLEIIFEGFGWCRQEGKLLKLSTGGWSGNEDAINGLMSNYMFQAICWLKSERGGHYEFELPEDSWQYTNEVEWMGIHKPSIEFYGPLAEHDQACAVFHHLPEPAVFHCNEGVFLPSWKAQKDGWRLVKADTWVKRLAIKLLFEHRI